MRKIKTTKRDKSHCRPVLLICSFSCFSDDVLLVYVDHHLVKCRNKWLLSGGAEFHHKTDIDGTASILFTSTCIVFFQP